MEMSRAALVRMGIFATRRQVHLVILFGVLVAACLYGTGHAKMVLKNGQLAVEQLGECGEVVTWQITTQDPTLFATNEPMLMMNLIGPATNTKMECPAMTSIIVVGVADQKPIYAGRIEGPSWMLKKADLSTVANIELAGEPSERMAANLRPLDEIDILAPYGIERGMPVAQANKLLESMNFVKSGGSTCVWRVSTQGAHLMLSIDVQSAIGKNRSQMMCKDDEIVSFASIEQQESRQPQLAELPSPAAFAQAWRDRFGAPLDEDRCGNVIDMGHSLRVLCIFRNVNENVGQILVEYSLEKGAEPRGRLVAGVTDIGDMPESAEPRPGSVLGEIKDATQDRQQ